MRPVMAPPSYPPTSYSSTQLTSYDQNSYSQQNTHGQVSGYGQQSSYEQRLRILQDSSVHSDRTTPVAWVFMGRSLEDFLDQKRTGA
ncbi:hypothetical protein GH733_005484 [Mirounga leonina]|nr:hypothetical protein GH733_005484 [Mirounga leonina]